MTSRMSEAGHCLAYLAQSGVYSTERLVQQSLPMLARTAPPETSHLDVGDELPLGLDPAELRRQSRRDKMAARNATTSLSSIALMARVRGCRCLAIVLTIVAV